MTKYESGDELHAQDNLLSNVAMLYYKEGLTQSEISKRIGVSRASVVNYLRQARDTGIVDIRIQGSAFAGSSLSRKLCQKYGLDDVYIARASDEMTPADTMRLTAQVGAMAMYDLLIPGDWLGVSWGETVQLAASAFPDRAVPDLTVCQMLGSMSSPTLSAAEDCAIQLANRTDARCFTLHAPAIVSNAELAQQLREEPIIDRQLKRFSKLTKAFFSVGSMETDTLMVTSGICTNAELEIYRASHATAVLCGRFIDAQGAAIDGDLSSRIIGVDMAELAAVPMRMCIASGLNKVDAIRAIIAGGYVSHLVVDENAALALEK